MFHLTDNPKYRASKLEIKILINCNGQNFDNWIRIVSKSKRPLWRPEREWTEVILCISDALQRTEAVFDVDSKFFVLDDIDFL